MMENTEKNLDKNMDIILGALEEMGRTNCDVITFLPGDGTGLSLKVDGYRYTENNQGATGNMGDIYQIVLWDIAHGRQNEAGGWDGEDIFEAVLLHPATYVKRMVKDGWYGAVARKTTKSHDIINALLVDKSKAVAPYAP